MKMTLSKQLLSLTAVVIRQRKEAAEFFGVETRNKYLIEDESGNALGFAAEQQKGLLGFVARQIFGHWRSFEILVFAADRSQQCVARHPLRFYFQKIAVSEPNGKALGSIERRFSFFSKTFEILDASGAVIFSVSSPLWKVWTFPLMKDGVKRAEVQKKWGGLLKEALLDADTFRVEFTSPTISENERLLVIVTAVFIDLLYFEKKAGFGSLFGILG